jgi:hypothetical protein
MFSQFANPLSFLLCMSEDAIFLCFDPIGAFYLFWYGHPHLIDDVEEPIFVY